MAWTERVAAFPFLSDVEFVRACEQLCQAFEHARHLQRDWTSVRLETHASHPALLCIQRVVDCEKQPASPAPDGIADKDDLYESDEEALTVAPPQTGPMLVEYYIALSPVYRVPVLYFNVKRDTSPHITNLDLLYQHLIPEGYKSQIGAVGVMGGITLTNHPVTGRPTYHVHPCETASALQTVAPATPLSLHQYLELWLGLIGGCVGLYLPTAIASQLD